MTPLESNPGSARNNAATLFDQALALFRGGRLAEAKRIARRILVDQPTHGQALHLLSVALIQQGNHTEALRYIDAAMQIEGQSSSIYNSRGNVFAALQRYGEAVANYDKAIALKSDFAEAFCSRGLALHELNRFDEALASYDKAIALTPDYAEAFCSRGATLQALKRLDEALASYDTAIALNPHYADAYTNRALIRLLIGRYHEGWPDNEWRWKVKDCASNRPNIKTPTWRGENLSGRHILVFSEQGLGDVIQFVRFLPLLAERKCKVTLLAPAKLVSLLRLSSDQIEIISELGNVESVDFQVPLMSLPHVFDTRLETIPSKTPYLVAPPERVKVWEEWLPKSRALRVGVGWAGNPIFSTDTSRSIGLSRLLPLLSVPGVQFVSLQKDLRSGDEELLRQHPQVIHVGDRLENFGETAAVMSLLDLVISSDTAPVHLAGALGRPVWILLQYVPDWRWLLDRDDSPWYPSARLFRQPVAGDWQSVVAKVIEELSLMCPPQRP